jgi:DNA-binding NarL/FixJ family response regulator
MLLRRFCCTHCNIFMSTNAKRAIRILLVDDHQVIRAGLRMLLESRPGMTVVGEAGTRADAITMASREKPDIILLDLDLGRSGSGIASCPSCYPQPVMSYPDVDRRADLSAPARSPSRSHGISAGKPLRSSSSHREVYAGEVWLDAH